MTVTIELIKQKILDKAMRGELAEQDQQDEPVGILLNRIDKEKEKLIKEKVIKKQKHLPLIEKEEKPYNLPNGWKWVRLGDIAEFRKGPFGSSITKSMFVPQSKNTVKIYEQQNAIKKNPDLGSYYITEEKFESLKRFEVYPGDIIVSCAGTIGETYVLPDKIEKGIINQALMIVKLMTGVSKSFFLYCFDALLKGQVSENSKGSAIKNIPPIADLRKMLFPLPPIEEQQRVVEKIELLFSLSNKWEQEVKKQQRYLSVLRDKILDDAMRGLLVEQDENDEPIEVLLKNIEEGKEKLIKEQKIKRQKPFPTIENEEIPYRLPKEWRWMRLGEIGSIIGGGTPKTSNPKFWSENEIPWLTPADLSKHVDKYISRGKRDISLAGLNGSSARLLPAGSVLFSSRAPIGYVAISKNELATNQGFKSVVPYIKECNQYLYYYLKSVGNKINERASGTTFKEISGKQLSLEFIAIPPIQEQQRIVEKIERLFDYIDELESQITLPK